MESYGLLSLREQAAIPSMEHMVTSRKFQEGACAPNVDGVCISGGTKVSGSSGYQLASMGYPAADADNDPSSCSGCHAFPLWYSSGRTYQLWGTEMATSRNPLMVQKFS